MTSDNSIQNWIDAKELFEKYIDQSIAESLQNVKEDKKIPHAVKSILINLINSQNQDDTIIDRADMSFFQSIDKEVEDLSGKNIGDYRLIQRIGQGGMSNVYKAKRKDNNIQKFVALKLLTSIEGELSDTLKILFEREQVTLSKLSHPHIISFHHGGISQNNIPFLVMDFIEDAKNINQHVADNNLSNREIVVLVKKVADAINYAHQNLIIHKDIKPNNVLIDQLGMPKVVDFGIASFEQIEQIEKDQSSNLTALIFTPDYASPEQIKNENITANSDVFSLAALLLELLSKTKPLPEFKGRDIDQTHYKNHINNVLSNINITTDLHCIIIKAMQIDKKDRYQSMLGFVDDLDAFLKTKPIAVRKQTALYLFSKYINRNPGLSLSILAFSISAMIGVITTIQQKNKAQLAALKAQQVTDFLVDSIQINDPDINKGKEVTVKELLLNAKIKIQQTSFQDQLLSTALEQTIGSALAKIGQYKEAEKLLKKAITSDNNNYAARISLALLYLKQQYFKKTQTQLNFLMTHKNALSHPQLNKTNQIEANLLFNQGKFEEAINTINAMNNSPSLTSKQIIDNKFILSKIINEQGHHQQAIEILYEALALSNNEFSETSTTSTNILFRIASVYSNINPIPEQKLHQVYAQTLQNQLIIYGKNHPHIAKTYLQYGFALKTFGKFEKSHNYALKARKIATDNFGENHMLTAHIDLLVSQLSFIDNNIDTAIFQLENVVKVYENHYGENHFETNQTKTTLAGYYLKAGFGQKALSMLYPLYKLQKQQYGESNKATVYVKMNIIKAYNLTKKYQQAIDEGSQLLSLARKHLGNESILTIGTQITLAESYLNNNQFKESEKLSHELLEFDLIKNNPRYMQKISDLNEQANVKTND